MMSSPIHLESISMDLLLKDETASMVLSMLALHMSFYWPVAGWFLSVQAPVR